MAVIQGLEQFEAKMKTLPLIVQRKVLVAAVKDAGEIIRQGAQDDAPVLTGHLSAGEVISVVASQSNAYYVLIRIGPSRKVFYGIFPEHGTAYMEAEPWLEPSFENRTKALALARVSKAFKEAIESV